MGGDGYLRMTRGTSPNIFGETRLLGFSCNSFNRVVTLFNSVLLIFKWRRLVK